MTRLTCIAAAAVLAFGLSSCNEPSSIEPVAAAPSPAAGAAKSGPQTQLAADMDLSTKVKDALQQNRVEVAASDGVVTLYGTVENPGDKDRLALTAMNVEGVRSVVNNLVVMRSS